jgi:hypothetical protein
MPYSTQVGAPRGRGPSAWRALLALVLACAAVGCVPNDASYLIVQNQVPTPSGTGGTCTVTSDPNASGRNTGVMDLLITDSYEIFPLYRSELLAYRDPSAGRGEVRGLVVTSVQVELRRPQANTPPDQWPLIALRDANNGTVPSAYTVSTSVFIPPGTMAGPGYAVGPMLLIPPSVGDALKQQVCEIGSIPGGCRRPTITSHTQSAVAVLRPTAMTMGGLMVEGAPFQFPMDFCCGCRLTFPPEADDPATPGHDCNARVAVMTPVCLPGQDDLTDCRLCNDPLLCQPPDYGCPTTP